MKEPEEIAYVFGGPVNLTVVRAFVKRHDRQWTAQEQKAWENDPQTTLVRAIGDPRDSTARLVGVLLVNFQNRHIRLDRVAVETGLRRKRVATNMFFNLVLDPRVQQYATISAFCADHDDAGIAWLKSCCFKAISVVPGVADETDQYLFSWSYANIRETLGDENAETVGLLAGGDPAAGGSGYPLLLPHPDPDK